MPRGGPSWGRPILVMALALVASVIVIAQLLAPTSMLSAMRGVEVGEAMQRLRASELDLMQIEYDTQADLASAHFRVRGGLRRIALTRDTLIRDARQALAVAESAYSAAPSKVDFDAVVNSQRQLLSFQIALERSRTDTLRAIAELERILGREQKNGGKP